MTFRWKLLRVHTPYRCSIKSLTSNRILLGPAVKEGAIHLMSLLLQVQKMTAVSLSIRVPIIFIAILCSVQMHMFRSSYFKISSQCHPCTEEDFFLTKTVHDELSCATTCNANIHCHAALFDKDSKKCSLLKAKRTLQRPSTDQSCDTGKIALEKVSSKHKGL